MNTLLMPPSSALYLISPGKPVRLFPSTYAQAGNAALSVAVPGDSIRAGTGRFAPITIAGPGNVAIYGSGKPRVDSVAAPTTLVGGTIFDGPYGITAGGTPLGANGMQLFDLGIDSGSAVCAALYGGAAQDGLVISNVPASHPTGLPQLTDARLRNVIALAAGPLAQTHAIRVENVDGAILEALEGWYATHCCAVKGSDISLFGGLFCGGGNSHLYIKSDGYAPTSGVNASNIVCRTAGASGGAAWGIAVDAYSAAIANINVSNAVIEAGILQGLEFNAANGMSGVSMANVAILAGTPVIWTTLAQPYVTFSGVTADGVAQYPTIYVGSGGGAPAFQDSWANYGSGYSGARFWKDAGGVVHLAGLVTAGTGPVVFALPAGYRPTSPSITVPCAIYGGSPAQVFNGMNVFSNGLVGPYAGTAGTYWLDGITFSTD